jgi:hypothetical protein
VGEVEKMDSESVKDGVDNESMTNKVEPDDVLHKKVSISVGKLLLIVVAGLMVLFFVSGAFLFGRYVVPASTSIGDRTKSMFSAYVTVGDDTSNVTSSVVEVIVENEPQPVEVVETDVAETAEPEVEVVEEVLVTSGYSNVLLSFTRTPVHDWQGTWGRLETIYYEIENNEDGTILPDSFIVTLEGYEDFTRTVDVPGLDQRIISGDSGAHGFDFRFSYSEAVTDPTNVGITLVLKDSDNRTMATAREEFNLK